MRLELILITPDLAEMFLKKNGANRKLRDSHVSMFCRELREGTFRTTHHGVAVSKTGMLLDGQHRLAAIVKTGIAATMVVAWDCEAQRAIDWPVDFGTPRSASDIMGFTKEVAAMVDLCLWIYTGEIRRYSTQERQATYDIIKSSIESLVSFSDKKIRTFSRSSVRVPAMLRLRQHPTYAGEQYRALVHLDYDAMSQATKGYLRRLTEGQMGKDSTNASLAARSWMVFDVTKANNTKQQVADPSIQIKEMRMELGLMGMTALDDDTPEPETVVITSKKAC